MHQLKAKYCLKLQGVENTKYVCSYCNKNLSDKRLLETHEEKCGTSKKLITTLERKHQDMIISFEKKILLLEQENKYYKETIAELKCQNSQFQSKLENIAVQGVNKPTTTNNIIKIQNLTDEWLKESSNNFSDKNLESKLFNGWFSGNTTNFNIKK